MLRDASKPAPKIEVLKYALQMQGIDFGNLVARNSFVRLVVNPLMDSVLPKLKADHAVNSETRYTVKMIIESESEREIEIQ